MSQQKEALKYEPVTIAPVACSAEEQDLHVRAFIKQFIVKEAQSRWIELLIDKRQELLAKPDTHPAKLKLHRASDQLFSRFCLNYLEQYCTPLVGTQTWPMPLRQVFGEKRGVYFDLNSSPCTMTAAEAAMTAYEDNAILSFIPGETALFFTHEGPVWVCEKRMSSPVGTK